MILDIAVCLHGQTTQVYSCISIPSHPPQALNTTPTVEGCQSYPVKTGTLDLASLDSVRSFASSFNARGLPLSLLICNAGIMAPPQRLVTRDGLEQQFQVCPCSLLQVTWLTHYT